MNPNELRPVARVYITTVAVLALGLVVLELAAVDRSKPGDLLLAVIFAGCTALAWLFPIHFAFRTKLHVDTAVTVAAILLFEPGIAMLIAGTGTLIAHAIRPASRDAVQALFNSAVAVLQAAVGALLLAGAGWNPIHPAFGRPGALLILPIAGVTMHLVNVLAVASVIALQERLPITRSWQSALLEDGRAEALAQASLLALGVLTAIVSTTQPWALVLLAVPIAGTLLTLQHHVRLRDEAEQARLGSDVSLAEAQRIARLGSWEMDLGTDRQRWSDETYRIFGFTPRSVVPTRDVFLSCIHLDDRPRVEAAIGRAASQGASFSIEHRILRVDGSERIVHQRGEVVVGPRVHPGRLVGTVHDVTERKALEGLLAHRAFHDPLTDLPNRALFVEHLGRALDQAQRSRASVAVLFLDLDGFKLVNDSLGHAAGDELLVSVGERLRECVSTANTTVARFGGDEFAVLLGVVADVPAATAIAEHVIAALHPPFALDGQETFVTASIGIAIGGPGKTSPSNLLRAADIALYRAKASGRGSHAVFEPAMQAQVLARLQRETALRRAVAQSELRLHYQPEVELATGRILGVEALVRWDHPDLGLLAPREFIQLAEETGLILPIGLWTLREACHWARLWQDMALQVPFLVGVNISARQFQDRSLAADVAAVLSDTGLDPHRLELEVTESVAMADAVQTRRTLDALRDQGVRLAIDDFGTGFASLGFLRELAPDVLKVDRSFVSCLVGDAGSRAIVRAVTTLAHDLGMVVTAEGIETDEQATHLRNLGVDRGQGFYFAPPTVNRTVGTFLTTITRLPHAAIGATESGIGAQSSAAAE